jgi:hypothetical protein
VACTRKNSNKCYMLVYTCRMEWVSIDRVVATLCGGTEGDLYIVWYITVPKWVIKVVYLSCRRETSRTGP